MNRGDQHGQNGRRWGSSTLAWGICGAFLLWAAFPPAGLAWLAWLAPVPWLVLIRRRQLGGPRPYRALWLAGTLHWLCMLYGIRLAHPANNLGWLVLSVHLGGYLPLFVGLGRVAVHRMKIPMVAAAPVIWVALELIRGHLFTGFSMGLLAHSQYRMAWLLQIAELTGAYGVSLLVMLAAAAIAQLPPMGDQTGWRWTALVPPVLALASAAGYGQWRTQPGTAEQGADRPVLKVLLIQCDFQTRFTFDPERNRRTVRRYFDRTVAAARAHPDADLIVWPESVFTGNTPEFQISDPQAAPTEIPPQYVERLLALFRDKREQIARAIHQATGRPDASLKLLLGTETHRFTPDSEQHFNTALLLDETGAIVDRYYKMHPVMFGEYIPLGKYFPWIYRITPLPRGLTPGPGPKAFEVAGWRLAPSICFESTVPHLIRRQVQRLDAADTPPHLLINITHDGWFQGSGILDLQLMCAVFRAVELRRPMLVAANSGFSAWIDSRGIIRAQGPRHGEATLVANVPRTPIRATPYQRYGDLFALACLLATLAVAAYGLRDFSRQRAAAE